MLDRIFVALAVTTLTACVPSSYDRINGIGPILDASRVEADTLNQLRILNSFASTAQLSAQPGQLWYEVTRAGFLHIDRECAIYIDQLYRLDRQKHALKGGLNAIGQSASAISYSTGASALTIAVLSQAFGLANSLVDIASDSLLHRMSPGKLQSFVRSMQNAYKAAVEIEKTSINSATAASAHIQSYLELCLSPRIEAEILDHIGNAQAVAGRVGPSGGPIETRIGSRNLPEAYRGVIVIRPDAPLKPAPRPQPAPGETYLSDYERKLPSSRILAIQDAVCATERNGQLGPSSSATRRQIGEFLYGRSGSQGAYKGIVTAEVDAQMSNAIAFDPLCDQTTFKTPYEVGRFGGPPARREARIKELQRALGVAETGIFDRYTRQEIRSRSKSSSDIVTRQFASELLEKYNAPAATNDAAPVNNPAPQTAPAPLPKPTPAPGVQPNSVILPTEPLGAINL